MAEAQPNEFPRYASPHSLRNRVVRGMWKIVSATLFRPSPRFLFGWRNLLLRGFGASLGRDVKIDPTVRIWAPWNLRMGDDSALAARVDCLDVETVTIGCHVSVSQDSFLCTASHDLASRERVLVAKPIAIRDGAWLFARAYVGPGVTIGEGSAVAACAVVVKDVEPWTIVGGNPALVIKRRELTR